MSNDKSAPTTTTATVAPSTQFDIIIAAFAAKIGLTVEAVKETLLKDAINDTSDDSVAILGSAHDLPNETWSQMFPAVKKPVLNNAVNALRVAVNPVAPAPAAPAPAPTGFAAAATGFAAAGMNPMAQLEPVGDDASFLSLLVTGGNLADGITVVDAQTVARVAMAQVIRLFDVPTALADRIETTAEASRVPVDGKAAWDLINSINAREYSDILRVVGAPVRAVGATHRKKFLDRVNTTFLPGLRAFHGSLSAWYESYRVERNDVGNILGVITGGMGGVMPIMTDVSPLRSAAAAFTDACNQTFAGMYAVPVARAMATDAISILQQLNDSRYMVAAGFTTREEMFRTLGVDVSEQFARNAKALEVYIVNVLKIPSRDDAALPMFAQNLYLIGQGLDWAHLGAPDGGRTPVKGSTGRKQVVEDPAFAPFPAGGNGRGAYPSR